MVLQTNLKNILKDNTKSSSLSNLIQIIIPIMIKGNKTMSFCLNVSSICVNFL